MKIRSVSRVLLAATPMVVGGILASGSSALAQSNNGPCSNATLSGDYAGRFAGTILATAIPVALRPHICGVRSSRLRDAYPIKRTNCFLRLRKTRKMLLFT